jgi:sugar phosphate isomerase/epimerase
MAPLPIAAQLYTLREVMPSDVPGTLRTLAGLGYDGVELAGPHNTPARMPRELLDELGLKICSNHVALDRLEGDLDRVVEENRALGCSLLIVPSVPQSRRDDFPALGVALTRLGQQVRQAGMRLVYHNHDYELRDQGGKPGLEMLLETTDPALVGFELDCGWAWKIGQDPLAWMQKLAGRLRLLHVKDVTADGDWAEVGQGAVPYGPILDAAPGLGVEWLIVEQDTSRRPPLESLGISIAWLRERSRRAGV